MAQLETRLGSLARSLASFRPERGVCISLFLGLDASVVPTVKDLSSHVRSIVDDARRQVDEVADELAHDEEVAARDAAHVGRTFVLAPLLESLERDRELILVAVGRERGTVWRTRSGRTELLEDRTEEIGRRHDQGGD